jgi:hypothetical protein
LITPGFFKKNAVKRVRSFLAISGCDEAVFEAHNFLPNAPARGPDGSRRGSG